MPDVVLPRPKALFKLSEPPFAHTGTVVSVQFSRDGSRIATAGGDIRIWDTKTGALLHQWEGAGRPTFVLGDEQVVYGGPAWRVEEQILAGGTVAIDGRDLMTRNLATGALGKAFGNGSVSTMVVTPNGRVAATGSRGNIRFWSIEHGREIREFPAHKGTVQHLAFSVDGRILASRAAGELGIWHVGSSRNLRMITGISESQCTVAISPDGNLLSTAIEGDQVGLFEVATGRLLLRIGVIGAPAAVCVAFSPDGKQLAVGGREGSARLFTIPGGQEAKALRPGSRKDWMHAVAFSPDGKLLAVGGSNSRLHLFYADTGDEVFPHRGHAGKIVGVGAYPTSVVTAGEDETIRFWPDPVKTTSVDPRVSRFPEAGSPNGMDHDRDRTLIATAWDDGVIRLFPPMVEGSVRELVGHDGPALAVRFSGDGVHLVSGGIDKTARLWNAKTGEEEKRIQVFSDDEEDQGVRSVSLSPYGVLMAAAGRFDGKVDLYDVVQGQLVGRLASEAAVVFDLDFSPDGTYVAVAHEDDNLAIWNLATGTKVRCSSGHHANVLVVRFSPRGEILAAGSANGFINLWNPSTGELLRTVDTGAQTVTCLDFDGEGRALVAGMRSGVVAAWSLAPRGSN